MLFQGNTEKLFLWFHIVPQSQSCYTEKVVLAEIVMTYIREILVRNPAETPSTLTGGFRGIP